MTWKHWPTVCVAVMAVGALLTAAGQVAALATGQSARGIVEEERRFAESSAADAKAGRTDGAGPGVGIAIGASFMCCVPLLFPAGYTWIAHWVMRRPLGGVRSPALRWLAHAAWAGWCGGVVLFCLAFGAAGEPWGRLQWEWPGFWLQSVGSLVSVARHALAAFWRPARAEPGAAADPGRL
jgi:hypothetical protein